MKKQLQRRLELRIVTAVWTTIPETTRWIRHYRDRNRHIDCLLLSGINANLILATATCIEGFAVECLQAMVVGKRAGSDLEAALPEDFYDRAANARGFRAASDLYRVVCGRSLLELLRDRSAAESIEALFAFRNCLAHGKSSEYRSYSIGPTFWQFEHEHCGGYRKVEEYLLKKKLLLTTVTDGASGWDFMTSEIADHFVHQMEPTCRLIHGVLPVSAQRFVISSLKMAFEQKRNWSDT